jgi:16S rRNA (cytidine1402-2'-O)-methyltransferase
MPYSAKIRTTAKLPERYAIRTKLLLYHEHNAAKVRPGIIEKLRSGMALALVSDAGTPLVSDPGYRLVAEALASGIAVTACPGPSAVLTGLALSGLPTDRFTFLGFLPTKSGDRKRLYAEFAQLHSTLVFFESPHRIVARSPRSIAWPGAVRRGASHRC